MPTPSVLSIQYNFSSLDTFISGSVDRRLASLWCQRVALFLAFAIAVSTSTCIIKIPRSHILLADSHSLAKL